MTIAFALSLQYGSKNYTLSTVFDAVFHYKKDVVEHQIIYEIRMPRAVAAALIGSFLALSGCVMQVLTRNPLAEPQLLGVSYGAAFALVITLAFYPTLSMTGTMLASIVGAGIAVVLVFGLAAISNGATAPVKLALAGVALGMFLSSLTSCISLYFDVAKDMSFWYAGGLSAITWTSVKLLSVAGLFGYIIVALIARALTILHLGEDMTKGLGIHIGLVRVLGVMAVLLLTGSSVAVSGTIGFIGLVVPHICRMLVGTDYRLLLPVSALFGAALLLFADLGAKLINPPYETPVGVITALIGVPFFIYLVRRGRGPSF
ncbi:iron ABC transporter permease [Bacillus sp. AGMB 02131]|uniref:Iron ABC transporter permease n=2 Tax=Peribacillus faecalis TaxID=2772559 RepID=A0A927H8Y5_9BACI|nr:iron ABC transporter permease [Peribacillus faecalis]